MSFKNRLLFFSVRLYKQLEIVKKMSLSIQKKGLKFNDLKRLAGM